MNREQLKGFLEDLEFVFDSEKDFQLVGFSGVKEPLEMGLCFLKSKDFLKQFLESDQNFGQTGVLVEKALLSDEIIQRLKERKTLFTGFITKSALAMAKVSKPFYDNKITTDEELLDGRTNLSVEIDPSSHIAQNVFIGMGCKIEDNVTLLPGVVLMPGVVVGAGSKIYPNVTVYSNVKIGKGCRIHSGTVLGADGFGYEYDSGKHHKTWHYGGVEIGDGVEIGSNSCIDGGVFNPTTIGTGTIIDNHVQIGHNCKIGNLVVLCGHVAIGGSARIGDGCVFAGRSGIGPNMELGPGCQVAGGALVNRDWPAGSKLGGHPARELDQWMKGLAYIRKMSLKR